MPVCGFCGTESYAGARSCPACGNVFGGEPAGAVGAHAPRTPGVETGGPPGKGFNGGALARQERGTRWILLAAALVALADAAFLARDATRVLNNLRHPIPVSVAPHLLRRRDLLGLADWSLTLGALVALGGWCQQAYANVAALTAGTPRHARWAVAGWLVPGLDVVVPPLMLGELWRSGTPSLERGALRLWQATFAAGMAGRLALAVVSFGVDPAARTSAAVTGAGALGTASLVLWASALLLTPRVLHDVGVRHTTRATLLDIGEDIGEDM